jgi:hypothetical protein
MHRLFVALVILCAGTLPVQAATYYMSPTGSGTVCTSGTPCSSFDAARPLLNTGDTLLLHGGTYNTSLVVNNSNPLNGGTSWSSPTTIRDFGDGTVTINGRFDLNGYNGNSTAYLIIKGIIWQGGPENAISGPGMNHIQIEDCEIRNFSNSGIQSYNSPGGHRILRNKIHHNGDTGGDHGIYGLWTEGLIEGNEFYNNSGYGLQFYVSDDSGCTQPPALAPKKCGTNTIIRNNKFYSNGTVEAKGAAVIGRGDNILFYNNLIYNNASSPAALFVNYGEINNAQIYNNTFYGDTNVAIRIANDFGNVTTNTVVKNNIFNNNGGAIVVSESTGTVFEKNLCGGTGLGCTNVGDPQFDNASGGVFTLQAGSAARNQGVALTAFFTTDFAGTTRPQGTAWDIGAYEYPEGGGVTPTGNPIYLSAGGHSDTPSDAGDCIAPENIATPRATLAGVLPCMTVPGKILYIRGGIYAGAIDTGGGAVITGGTSASAPTRIEGYQSEAVTLQLPVGGSVGLFVRDVSFLTVAKLTVDAMARADSNAFACVTADHITLTQVTARNSYYEPGYFSGCSDSTVSLGVFHTSQVAPVVTLEGTNNNLTLDQLELHTGTLEGLSANVSSGSNTNLVVSRTQIHGTGTGAGTTHALDLGPGSGALLVNNIIDHNKAGVRIRSGAGSVKVYHNAVASNTPGTGLQCDAGATSVTISNNISFGNGTNAVVNNCAAMLATNLDNGTDPQWVNVAARDFHTQLTSDAINMGTALPEVTIAIDGTVRPVGLLYDAGPYETTKTGLPGDPSPPPLVLIRRWLGMLY